METEQGQQTGQAQPTEQTQAAGGKTYAGFLERLVAILIDGFVLAFAGAILGRGRMGVMSSFIGALYAVLLWVNWNGQTLGKKLMKIKVVREDGQKLDYATAVVRYLGYILSALALCLGYLWVLWDEKKQGWHDKIAKTLVVKE